MSPSASVPPAHMSGAPTPRAVTLLTRVLQLALLLAVCIWIFAYLGGLHLSPIASADGASNDTGPLFNLHPLLMTLGFPILMAEAVLAYKAPLAQLDNRQQAKLYHFAFHTAAMVCTVLGVVAAFKSHTLKRPVPTPNLYSAHSWLGLAVLSLLGLQYLGGAAAYLWPKLPLEKRRALGPLHMFLGRATFVAGLATMAAGIQEKQTFIQAFAKPASVFVGVMRLPAAIQVLLLLVGLLVLFHHVPPMRAATQDPGCEVTLLGGEAGRSEGGVPAFQDDNHVA